MGRHIPAACPQVGTLPDEFASKLPKGVPAVERPPTSLFPFQSVGPGAATWYFPTALPATSPAGVFIPQGFGYPEQVDVILYFHGNKDGSFHTINQYWHGDYHKIALREDLVASRRDALLVAPTMGFFPGHGLRGNSDLGIFAQPGGGDCFLDHVMAHLNKYDDHYASKGVTPKARNVVLAGHSGGGNAIHLQLEPMKARVCEAWCFDIVYGDVNDWVDFAVRNPSKILTFFHAIQSLDSLRELVRLKAKTEATLKIKLDNLRIIDAGNDHFAALTNNFLPQLKATKCLATL